MARFNCINTVSFDHPDPSIFTVLTAPSAIHGTANVDFAIFPPRWLVAEHTFRPPWFHRNMMNEFMGLIFGQYDAKAEGFLPGGASLHNCMSGHGPDAETFERATAAELKPQHIEDTLAFMFETRLAVRPTRFALETKILQHEYYECWQGLKKQLHRSPGPKTQPMTTATSWVGTANDPDSGFPLQTLPYCVFTPCHDATPRLGIGIGEPHPRPPPAQRASSWPISPTDVQLACTRPDAQRRSCAAAPPAGPPCANASPNSSSPSSPAPTATPISSAWSPRSCSRRPARDSTSPSPRTTTPTSTPPSITPPTSAGSSAPTIRCCPTTNTSPSAITAAHLPSSSAARPSAALTARLKLPDQPTPVFGPTAQLDYELEVGRLHRHRQSSRHSPSPSPTRRAPHLRPLPPQRLVRPRHPVLGVPAPRPLPRQEFRDQPLALGRPLRSPRSLPRAARPAPRTIPHPLPYLAHHQPRPSTSPSKSSARHRAHARARPAARAPQHRQPLATSTGRSRR